MCSSDGRDPGLTGDASVQSRPGVSWGVLRRRGTLVAVLAVLAVLVAAIAVVLLVVTPGGSGHHGGSAPSAGGASTRTGSATTLGGANPGTGSSGATTAPASAPGSAGATTTPGAVTGVTAVHGVPPCSTRQLTASLDHPSGAAGSVGYDLVFVNSSRLTCSLTGYPGVSYVAGSTGTTVGAPALRNATSAVVTVTLAPGGAARATVIEADSQNYPPETCRLSPVAGLRIYPPNQTAALFVAQPTQACANPSDPVLRTAPVRAP